MSRDAWAAPQMQRLFETGSLSGLSEWELVERFARHRDQPAFEQLVARHGPMVLGVCRRILHDPNDVDDAFQATFLVLVRRAPSLGQTDVVAAWLHGVALKVARRARSRRDRLNRRERPAEDVEPACPASPDLDFALRAVIDEEIDRLPWKYRAPVALCYLEGLTHDEAARRLNWPIGTVKGRLARARTTLGARLSRRGITSAAGAVGASLVLDASIRAAPPLALIAAAARASARIAEGRAWDAVASTSVAELVRGVFTTMFLNKMKLAAALLAMSGVAVAGAGVYGRPAAEDRKSDDDARPRVALEKSDRRNGAEPVAPDPEPPPPNADADPAAARRAGPSDSTDRLHERLLSDAAQVFRTALEAFGEGRVPAARVYQASRFELDARIQAANTSSERTAAYEKHLKRITALGEAATSTASGSTEARMATQAEVRAYRTEASLWLARSREEDKHRSARSEERAPGDGAGPEPSPATQSILARLDKPIPMNFPNEVPFEDVIKYVKQVTQGPDDSGIPIYVDPFGLQEAEKTMTSPISMDLDGVPLRRTLQLALAQLGLAYYVDDGILVITSESSKQNSLPPSFTKPLTLPEMRRKAERGELDPEEMKNLIEKLKLIKELKGVEYDQPEAPPVPARSPAGAPDQTKALIDQMKELTDALRADRERPRRGGLQ